MPTGTTTVDFSTGATDASVAVSAPGVSGSSLVDAWIYPVSTATNTTDNHIYENISATAGNVINGVGFTIYAKCTLGLAFGQYTVAWVYN